MMEALSAWEVQFLLFLQNYVRKDWMTWFWRLLSFLADDGWCWILLALILIIIKKTRWMGIPAAISMAIGYLVTNVCLKNLVARPRPYDFSTALHVVGKIYTDYSFPSGHTCVSFACSLILIRVLPKKYGITCVVISGLIAFSRMYLGCHYPTDILGGLIVAFIASKIAYPAAEKVHRIVENSGAR